jgi:TetR/AcrR family transcriptional repressor of nem operon
MGRKPNLEVPKLILEQAEHLIHLKGYHGTSMDDVALACKMTKANVIHHYGSKKALALAVLEAKIGDYRKMRVEPLCVKGDPVAGVGEMFSSASRHIGKNGCRAGCFVGNIALEMSDLNEEFRGKVSRFFSEWVESVSGCLQRAKDLGIFEKDLDCRSAAEAVVSLYEGAVMLARARRDASVLLRAGRMAQSLLESYQHHDHAPAGATRRIKTMGPKTPCGC